MTTACEKQAFTTRSVLTISSRTSTWTLTTVRLQNYFKTPRTYDVSIWFGTSNNDISRETPEWCIRNVLELILTNDQEYWREQIITRPNGIIEGDEEPRRVKIQLPDSPE